MENETQKPEDKISIWENIVKGWIASLIGLALILAAIGDYMGFYSLPLIPGVSKPIQIIGSMVIGFIAFFAPRTLEKKFEDLFDGFSKKKTQ